MKQRVAIVGGGLTGLVTALRLSQRGFGVTVFEKEKELGGLAADFDLNGTNLERTYHHIFKSDKDIIDLIEELGLKKRLEWKESSVAQYHRGRFYSFLSPMDLLKFKPLNLVNKVRLGLIFLYLQKMKKWKTLVNIEATEWMKKWAGKKNYQIVWEPLLRGKFHQYYKKVSMAWLWARINTRGKSKEKGGEKLGYMKGGFGLLINRLADEIVKNGGVIKTGREVNGIKNRKEKAELTAWGEKLLFDKAVACIPLGIFKKMTDQNQGLNKIPYLGFINVVFCCRQNLSQYYWHNISDADCPFLAFIQHTNLVSKKNYNNKHVYYLGTYVPQNHRYLKEKDGVIYKEFFDYLRKIFPLFDKKLVEEKKIFKFDWAQHVVDKHYEKKIPSYKTKMENVYFANFCQIFLYVRGMNYAVVEGARVAKLIV